MGLREPELPFPEISFQNKTVSFKADSPLCGGGAHEGQKVGQKASLTPGLWPLSHLVAAFFRSGYKMPPPLPSCWRFIPQASSPSSLEGLRTHLPGANTQEAVARLPAVARNEHQTGSACPGQPAFPRQKAWACPLLPPTSQRAPTSQRPHPQPRREPSLGRAILHLRLWDSYL